MPSPAALWVPPLEPQAEPAPPPPPSPDELPVPTVRWIGTPHFTRGRSAGVCAIVVHTMGGTLSGSDNWLQDPRSQVSYTFGIGLAGAVHQYVQLTDTPWANGRLEAGHRWPCGGANPNPATIAIGTEDLRSAATPVSEAQWQATLGVAAFALRRYPTIRYLLTHRAISPGSRPSCPGPRWVGSGRFQALAERLGLYAIW